MCDHTFFYADSFLRTMFVVGFSTTERAQFSAVGYPLMVDACRLVYGDLVTLSHGLSEEEKFVRFFPAGVVDSWYDV